MTGIRLRQGEPPAISKRHTAAPPWQQRGRRTVESRATRARNNPSNTATCHAHPGIAIGLSVISTTLGDPDRARNPPEPAKVQAFLAMARNSSGPASEAGRAFNVIRRAAPFIRVARARSDRSARQSRRGSTRCYGTTPSPATFTARGPDQASGRPLPKLRYIGATGPRAGSPPRQAADTDRAEEHRVLFAPRDWSVVLRKAGVDLLQPRHGRYARPG